MTTQNQRVANKHEAGVAAAFGGQVTPMSGAGWVRKNDVYTGFELIECKYTAAMSYSLKRELLQDIERAALLTGKRGLLHIKMEPSRFQAVRYVVLTEEDYLALSHKAGER